MIMEGQGTVEGPNVSGLRGAVGTKKPKVVHCPSSPSSSTMFSTYTGQRGLRCDAMSRDLRLQSQGVLLGRPQAREALLRVRLEVAHVAPDLVAERSQLVLEPAVGMSSRSHRIHDRPNGLIIDNHSCTTRCSSKVRKRMIAKVR